MTAHERAALFYAHVNAQDLVQRTGPDHPLHAAALVLLADTTSALAAVA